MPDTREDNEPTEGKVKASRNKPNPVAVPDENPLTPPVIPIPDDIRESFEIFGISTMQALAALPPGPASDMTRRCLLMHIDISGQGYPSAEAAMVAAYLQTNEAVLEEVCIILRRNGNRSKEGLQDSIDNLKANLKGWAKGNGCKRDTDRWFMECMAVSQAYVVRRHEDTTEEWEEKAADLIVCEALRTACGQVDMRYGRQSRASNDRVPVKMEHSNLARFIRAIQEASTNDFTACCKNLYTQVVACLPPTPLDYKEPDPKDFCDAAYSLYKHPKQAKMSKERIRLLDKAYDIYIASPEIFTGIIYRGALDAGPAVKGYAEIVSWQNEISIKEEVAEVEQSLEDTKKQLDVALSKLDKAKELASEIGKI